MYYLEEHFVLWLLYLGVKAQQYFLSSKMHVLKLSQLSSLIRRNIDQVTHKQPQTDSITSGTSISVPQGKEGGGGGENPWRKPYEEDLALSSYTFWPGAGLELDSILLQEEDLQWRHKEPVKDDKRAFYT